MTITEFLLARIAEDEAALNGPCRATLSSDDPARVLRECEAKRRIVEAHPLTRNVVPVWSGETPGVACANCAALGRGDGDIVEDIGPCDTLCALASVYADHPDYREEWKP